MIKLSQSGLEKKVPSGSPVVTFRAYFPNELICLIGLLYKKKKTLRRLP